MWEGDYCAFVGVTRAFPFPRKPQAGLLVVGRRKWVCCRYIRFAPPILYDVETFVLLLLCILFLRVSFLTL